MGLSPQDNVPEKKGNDMSKRTKNDAGVKVAAETVEPYTETMQLFLRVSDKGDEQPVLVGRSVHDKSYPANFVKLPGAVLELHRVKGTTFSKDDWEACGKVAELCRLAQESKTNSLAHSAIYDHLSDAHQILEDTMLLMADEAAIGCKTIYALLARIKWFLVSAGKCINCELESTREDAE